jgi:hypothetical protein
MNNPTNAAAADHTNYCFSAEELLDVSSDGLCRFFGVPTGLEAEADDEITIAPRHEQETTVVARRRRA